MPVLRTLACMLVLLCLSVRTAQANSRDQKWRTLETEHFAIHYYAGSEAAAERAARVLERAHARLSVGLGHSPYLRTHVVLTDATDQANGRATVFSYPKIEANVTSPDSLSTLENYDDWLDILLTHEYTHIVHNDTIHGVPRVVNAILGLGVLGRVWPPNNLQPRWVLEGLATYEESRLTSAGRHRSSQFDMMLRMIVLERGFPALDRVSGPATIYPYTTSVYLFGLHLMHYIGSHYGHDKLREMSHRYGGRVIPYGIHRTILETLGVDFDQLWKEFELETTRRFEAQARAVRARGVREGKRLTYSTASEASSVNRHPFWSPDDRYIYYYGDDGHTNPGLRRIPATGSRIREGVGIGRQGMTVDAERVVEMQGIGTASFIPGTDDLVFEHDGVHDFRYRWLDLYVWHPPEPGALDVRQNPADFDQLTTGLRARDPHPSPDGRTVVFVRNDVAQSRLAFVDLKTREVVELPPFERVTQIYSPRFHPDGRRVAFSAARPGGYRDLYVYDRGTKDIRRITADRFLDLNPAWSPDGRWLVFSSDRDGIFNLYAHDTETGALHQVTNVLGGAFDPIVSNDGTRLAYIGFSSIGYDVWAMKFDPAEFFAPLPTQDNLPEADDPEPALAGAGGRPPSLQSRRYRPIRTLYPRVILPASFDVGNTGNQGLDLGLRTTIADVVGFHSLSGEFRQFFTYNEPTGSVAYTYSQLLPTFSAAFIRDLRIFDSTGRTYSYDHAVADGSLQPYGVSGYRERRTRVRAGIDVPVIRHPIHNVSAGATYEFWRMKDLTAERERVDPNAPASSPPAVGDLGRVDISLRYDALRGVAHSYREETGRSTGVRLTLVDRHLGGQYGDIQVSASHSERVRMPWRGHQVLALRLSGGASGGGLGRLAAFTVGGIPQQSDIVQDFFRREAANEAGVLRGFARNAFGGQYFMVLNTEYRIPLADVERGMSGLPLFLRRVTAVPFADYGGAWTGGFTRKALKWGVGASLILSFRIGYREAIDLFITYAHGFDPKVGADLLRVLVGRSF
ncbi:MAG: PD40 domain-containing protein [Myxococcales bacterium]|nr:PD40 domain-containing protein [Myxococcales bacterium]